MFKYSDFIFESQLSLISESIIYFSPSLTKTLTNLSKREGVAGEISKDILSLELTDHKEDVTLIDFDEKPGYLTFTTAKNAIKNLKDLGYQNIDVSSVFNSTPSKSFIEYLYSVDHESLKKSRNPVRLGRLLNRLFPNKYTSVQIEEFTNKLKSVSENKGRFVLVSGDDIAFWYNYQNYYDKVGTLGGSCMRSVPKSYFKIYTENPDVCQMLCFLQDDESGVEKLKARALLWKVRDINSQSSTKAPEFEYYLDRQYAIEDSYIEKMRDYAKSQGWAYKTVNSHNSFSRTTFNDEKYYLDLTVKIKPKDYGQYPFMDTFRRFDLQEGLLFNDDIRDENYDQYILEDTNGGYEVIGSEDTVYCEYFDISIPEDQAVWSNSVDSWLPLDQSVYVRRGHHSGYYPEEYDDLVWDDVYDEYLYADDATWSEYHDCYILSEDSISIVNEVDDDGDSNEDYYFVYDDSEVFIPFWKIEDYVWFVNINEKNNNWSNHNGILKELLTKDHDDDWILKKFKITLKELKTPIYFQNENGEFKLGFIQEIDANILGLDIEENTEIISDSWTYVDGLKESNLLNQLQSLIKPTDYKQLAFDFGDGPISDGKIERIKERLEEIERFLV